MIEMMSGGQTDEDEEERREKAEKQISPRGR